MSSYRAAFRAAPVLLRGGRRAIHASRALPSNLPAIAILLPRRALSTETSTTSGGSGQPPPGFNLDQAKKPLPQEQQQATTKKEDSASKNLSVADLKEQVSIPKNEPSVHAPTKAAEAQSLTELAAQKALAEKADEKKIAAKKEEQKKLTIWQRIKNEVVHYWDGTKLLATEVKISSRLALKMAAGYELTRRENRQVHITTQHLMMSANTQAARKNCPRSGSACSVFSIRHRSFCRILAASCSEALPQSASEHVRRRKS